MPAADHRPLSAHLERTLRGVGRVQRSGALRALETVGRLHGPDSAVSRAMRSVASVSDVTPSRAGTVTLPSLLSEPARARAVRPQRGHESPLARVGASAFGDLDKPLDCVRRAAELEEPAWTRIASGPLAKAVRGRTAVPSKLNARVFDEGVRGRAGARATAGLLSEVTRVRATVDTQLADVLDEAMPRAIRIRSRSAPGLLDRHVVPGHVGAVRRLERVLGTEMRAAATPSGWQRAQLRTAERELIATGLAARRVGLERRLSAQLRAVRSLLAGGHVPAYRALAAGIAPVADAAASRAFAADVLAVADTAWLGRIAGDALRIGRIAMPDEFEGARALRIRALAARHATLPDAFPRYAVPQRLQGSVAQAAVGRMPTPAPWLTGLDLVSDPTAASAVTDDDDAGVRAVVALILWTHAAHTRLVARRRWLAEDGREAVAQAGDWFRELGGEAVGGLGAAAGWAWTVPLWAMRARRALAEAPLTPDERLGLLQHERSVRWAVGLAIIASLGGPPLAASWPWVVAWLGVWRPLQELYEEIARLCHSHGLDGFVPREHRHR